MLMTPKEKAKELYHKYLSVGIGKQPFQAIQDVLICVDEILSVYDEIRKIKRHTDSHLKYWQDVKQEIQKL